MIKAAIFDLDNTLYDFDAAHATALGALTDFAREKLALSPEDFPALHRRALALQRQRCGECAALHSRIIRCQLMLELLGRPIDLAPAMADLYWDTLMDHLVPLPGAAEALDALRAAGLTIGIGTNMTAGRQYEKLARLDVLRRVDFIVTSEEAGAEKPDARLFLLCAEKAGCAPAECAFIGDSLKHDALGARDAGLRAVWLCRKPESPEIPSGIVRIDALSRLPELLASL